MSYVVCVYALFILAGGIIGHAHGSTASLVMGVVFGVLLLTAAAGMFAKKKWGVYFALVLTLILDAFFTYRFVATLKFMPPGMLSLVSLGVMLLLVRNIRSLPVNSSVK
jgi:uncharacterized membrane protein (UPF0136 family)